MCGSSPTGSYSLRSADRAHSQCCESEAQRSSGEAGGARLERHWRRRARPEALEAARLEAARREVGGGEAGGARLKGRANWRGVQNKKIDLSITYRYEGLAFRLNVPLLMH